MGADAEIHVFDYQRYRTEVVPALVDLLRTGEPGPFLIAFFRDTAASHRMDFTARWPRMAAHLRTPPTDLARHCTWLGPDLRHRPEPWLGTPRADQRHDLVCPSRTCPERGHCLLHGDRAGAENVNILFEALVTACCLDRPQFVGRTQDPLDYWPLLDAWRVPAGDPLRRLLAALADRGAVLGYGFGVTEGVHGWLTEAETADLAHRLTALPLPRYEPTYEAMRDLHYVSMSRAAQARTAAPPPGPSWLEVSLSFVRTVAVIAAAENRAVLWGNDVGHDHWIDHFLD
ncbi:hypothetical protein [Actinoplanes derwentensis]|uniref:Uncharacterized protein n=1 Tax=Actinoplanes derwentensis TaxID=113562 RepID=A0A1H1WFA7_9ACTN|nr:hypothetical protein [Actinoplanes derwentensis]GID87390.1 hypothetical protein Ade03nite_63140 [Actinoplanes derwentensis]SDS95006.1 hypothetical protein SAMN04489716_2064 [Actinoplanes derwentensis]